MNAEFSESLDYTLRQFSKKNHRVYVSKYMQHYKEESNYFNSSFGSQYKHGNHRRTGTSGLGGWGAVTLLPEKNYAMPESESVVQMHSNCSKNKNVHSSRVMKLLSFQK